MLITTDLASRLIHVLWKHALITAKIQNDRHCSSLPPVSSESFCRDGIIHRRRHGAAVRHPCHEFNLWPACLGYHATTILSILRVQIGITELF